VLDLPEGNAMRAPGEAPGLMALEIAIDEMAEKLDRSRRSSASSTTPRSIRKSRSGPSPSASCRMPAHRRRALRLGKRGQPGQTRDGNWLIGMGVAAGFRNNLNMKSGARVRLDRQRHRDGRDRHDRHRHRQLHDHRPDRGRDDGRASTGHRQARRLPFPVSAGSGGQWGANSSTAGVYAACVKLREAVAQKLGFNPTDGGVHRRPGRSGGRSVPLAAPRAKGNSSVEDVIEYGDLPQAHQQSTFGAHFVEVGVDSATGEIRIRACWRSAPPAESSIQSRRAAR
jgi:xanthine dehydrogenase YagR molybdenum-binding subunit